MIGVVDRADPQDVVAGALCKDGAKEPGGLPYFELHCQWRHDTLSEAAQPAPSGSALAGNPGEAVPSHDGASPVRVHASWSTEGVRIWIGADAQVRDRLAQLAEQIQRSMRGRGYSVLAFYCNGTQVCGTEQEETTRWPSTR